MQNMILIIQNFFGQTRGEAVDRSECRRHSGASGDRVYIDNVGYRSAVYKTYSSGPSTHPRGTSNNTDSVVAELAIERNLLRAIRKKRFDPLKDDVRQSEHGMQTPQQNHVTDTIESSREVQQSVLLSLIVSFHNARNKHKIA